MGTLSSDALPPAGNDLCARGYLVAQNASADQLCKGINDLCGETLREGIKGHRVGTPITSQ